MSLTENLSFIIVSNIHCFSQFYVGLFLSQWVYHGVRLNSKEYIYSHSLFWAVESHLITWILQSILAGFCDTLVKTVSILLIFNSFSLLSNSLEIIPSAPTTTGITVIGIFYSFSFGLWLRPNIYLSFRFVLFSLCGPLEHQNPLVGNFFPSHLSTLYDCLVEIRWLFCISKL